MIGTGVPVKCRKCGKTANSNTFVLDSLEGMVICPNCVNARKSQVNAEHMKKKMDAKGDAKPEIVHPPGWDAEDEYLSKVSKMQQDAPQFKMLTDRRLQCVGCKYVFRYDRMRNAPKDCPFCGIPVKVGVL